MECRRNFPTDHFLSLHIAENHDPLNASKRDRGDKTYACFVEDCDKLCGSSQKRRMHLIDKHMFPRNYDFFIVNDGMDKRNSMLRLETGQSRRGSTADSARRMSTTSEYSRVGNGLDRRVSKSNSPDDAVEGISSAMAALKFVPPSVKFGRRKGGGGLAKS